MAFAHRSCTTNPLPGPREPDRESAPPDTQAEAMARAILGRNNSLARARLMSQSGRHEAAVVEYQEWLQGRPDHPEALAGLAENLIALGRLEEAEGLIGRMIDLEPKSAETWSLLGQVRIRLGRHAEAVVALGEAVGLNPTLDAAWVRMVEAHLQSGDMDAAEEAAYRFMDARPALGTPHTMLAKIFFHQERNDEAMMALLHALRLEPDNRQVLNLFRGNIGRVVRPWHFPMLNDHSRNDAYEKAISRLIRPGQTVLEIGTGTGLLSMIAARAGAGHVYTCEMIQIIARKAAAIVAHNGWSHRVTVIPKASHELRVPGDMPRQADLLIMEVFSSELLAENVLATLEDAKTRLLTPGAPVLPRAAEIAAYLVGGRDLERLVRVSRVCGFDLSSFNEFSPAKYIADAPINHCQRLSDDFSIFAFDFQSGGNFPSENRRIQVPVRTGGACLGALQWIRLDLAEGVTLSNHPDHAGVVSHWKPILFVFPEPVPVETGQVLVLEATHNTLNIHLNLLRVDNGGAPAGPHMLSAA